MAAYSPHRLKIASKKQNPEKKKSRGLRVVMTAYTNKHNPHHALNQRQ